MKEMLNDTALFAPITPDAGASNVPGRIYFANEARFTAGHLSEPLTGYIVGWQDPENLEQVLEAVAPAVPSGRYFSYRLMDNAQALLSETEDDLRAIGAAFKRVEYSGTSAEGKTDNRGLTIRLDKDEEDDSEAARQMYARMLVQRLHRNRLRRAIALIDAGATNVGKTWNSSANPDGDLRGMVIAGADAAGVYPNKVVIGEAAWQKRLDSYEAQGTSVIGAAALARDKAGLARYLGVDEVVEVKARYQSTASAKAKVAGAVVYGYYAMSGLTRLDPANVKRFVSNTAAGTPVAVYVEDHPKFVDISVECYERTIVVTTAGMRKLTIS
jgi:hypothetical protein